VTLHDGEIAVLIDPNDVPNAKCDYHHSTPNKDAPNVAQKMSINPLVAVATFSIIKFIQNEFSFQFAHIHFC